MESPQVNSVFRNIDIMNEIGQIGQMVPIPPKYDMVSIALQGIGHVFGLGHPSVREAIMYAYMDDKKCFFFVFLIQGSEFRSLSLKSANQVNPNVVTAYTHLGRTSRM